MKKTIIALLTASVLLFTFSGDTFARSGCCSHHGGVCGCGCCDGSPLSSTCAPYYPECNGGYEEEDTYNYYDPSVYVPICKVPNITNTQGGSISFSEDLGTCKQDASFEWEDVVGATAYSLYPSKSIYDEPDNISETAQSQFTFTNLESGKNYIHIKAKNSCGWSDSMYWTIDVPYVKPLISVREEIISESERNLIITSTCAKSITATNIGSVSISKKNILVRPKKDTDYVFTAKNGLATSTSTVRVKYPLPTPTPTNIPTPTPTPSPTPMPIVTIGKAIDNATGGNAIPLALGSAATIIVSLATSRMFKG